ncbi:hypothetical protein [Phormidium nigroviride]
MVLARDISFKTESAHNAISNFSGQSEKLSHHTELLLRLYQQSKQISQIIAYIWRWADDHSPENTERQAVASQLHKYFTHPTQRIGNLGGQLKKLFGAKPDPNGDIEGRLLYAVFAPLDNPNFIFPIFSEFELGEIDPRLGYLLDVNLNSFHGVIEDPTKNAPALLKFVIPYPPRPQLGELTVTTTELEEWVDNKEPRNFFADNVYIPTTST